MSKVVAVNGSPRMARGTTAMILGSFVGGMEQAGAEVETVYASRLKPKPCDCGEMRCWFKHPGECYRDDLRELHLRLERADILVLATPVYVPLPGDFQHLLNRLSPLIDPVLATRQGRTRARFREGVAIRKVVAVVVGGWWEKENLDPVVRIVRELAENAGAEFAGAVLRPHVEAMRRGGQVTEEGREILGQIENAGRELIRKGAVDGPMLDAISRPLISRATYNRWFSQSSSIASEDSAD